MKKKIALIVGTVLFSLLTLLNVSVENHSNSFAATILSNVEAYASGSEGGSMGHRCGRAAYSWKKGSDNSFVQCVKGCPDKSGNDPMYQDC